MEASKMNPVLGAFNEDREFRRTENISFAEGGAWKKAGGGGS